MLPLISTIFHFLFYMVPLNQYQNNAQLYNFDWNKYFKGFSTIFVQYWCTNILHLIFTTIHIFACVTSSLLTSACLSHWSIVLQSRKPYAPLGKTNFTWSSIWNKRANYIVWDIHIIIIPMLHLWNLFDNVLYSVSWRISSFCFER